MDLSNLTSPDDKLAGANSIIEKIEDCIKSAPSPDEGFAVTIQEKVSAVVYNHISSLYRQRGWESTHSCVGEDNPLTTLTFKPIR
jgi:hypothetical protein